MLIWPDLAAHFGTRLASSTWHDIGMDWTGLACPSRAWDLTLRDAHTRSYFFRSSEVPMGVFWTFEMDLDLAPRF